MLLSWKYARDTMEALTAERTRAERAAALEARLAEPFTTERQSYKSDGELGYRSDRTELLWLLEGETVRCLLDEQAEFAVPCWMPDDKTVLFQRTNEDGKLEFCTLDTGNGAVSTLATVQNVPQCFEDDYAPMLDTARRLLSPEVDVDGIFPQDQNFSSRGLREAEYVLMPDGYCCYTTGYRGDVRIAKVPAGAEDAAPALVTGEMANYHALSRYDDGHLLALCGLPDRMPEAALVDVRTGETTMLTDSCPWMREVQLQRPESVWTPSGTHGFYCSSLNYELQALAAAGFGVPYANPRGDAGRFEGGSTNAMGIWLLHHSLSLLEELGREQIHDHVLELEECMGRKLEGCGLDVLPVGDLPSGMVVAWYPPEHFTQADAILKAEDIRISHHEGYMRLSIAAHNTAEQMDRIAAAFRSIGSLKGR